MNFISLLYSSLCNLPRQSQITPPFPTNLGSTPPNLLGEVGARYYRPWQWQKNECFFLMTYTLLIRPFFLFRDAVFMNQLLMIMPYLIYETLSLQPACAPYFLRTTPATLTIPSSLSQLKHSIVPYRMDLGRGDLVQPIQDYLQLDSYPPTSKSWELPSWIH